jgi:hypothetical protein
MESSVTNASKRPSMDVGAALLARARAVGASSLAVVGTSKNAGKTVTIAALCGALQRESTFFGLCSIGRDGEAADALDGSPKPRLDLRAGTLIATAAVLLPPHPASEVVAFSGETSALGPIVFARVRAPSRFEISGPPNANAMRRIALGLHQLGARFVLIDGAVDRIAALRGGDDAIVVATGAAGAPTLAQAIDAAAALVARLRLPRPDPAREMLAISGALSLERATDLIAQGERRQIVVTDPTRIAFRGKTFLRLAERLTLRCEHPLVPVACTIASLAPERSFEPAGFLRGVARATGLPAFDVYAGEAA